MIQTSQIWDELSSICKPSRRLIAVVPTPTLLHLIGSYAMDDNRISGGRGGPERVHFEFADGRSIMLVHSTRRNNIGVLKELMCGCSDQDVALITFDALFEHQHYEMLSVVSAYRGTLKVLVVR